MDDVSKNKFMEYLSKIKCDKIIIIVTHYSSIHKYVDEILKAEH